MMNSEDGQKGKHLLNCIPMMDKLVNSSVIGANMCFGKLPQPIRAGIQWRGKDLFGLFPLRKTKLDGNRLQSAHSRQVQDGTGCISFPVFLSIDAFEKWEISIMIIQDE